MTAAVAEKPKQKLTKAQKSFIIRQAVEKMKAEQRRNLLMMAMPRLVMPYIPHVPHPTQQVFLSLGRYREVMFGGAAGGGKSDALLMAALQYVDVPGYAALLLRRSWPDLVLPGAIMDRAGQWLADTPARKRDGGRLWEFPSGARLQFGYLSTDSDKYRYASAEFQFIGFDELTQFPEEDTYTFLFSRNRRPKLACLNCQEPLARYVNRSRGETNLYKHNTTKGQLGCRKVYPDPATLQQYKPASDGTTLFDVPLRVRSASNPGGRGMEWVKRRLVDSGTRRAGTVFVPSYLTDNPSLDQDSYRESLSYLNAVEQARLEDGDWEMSEPGDMFDRADFLYVEQMPANVVARVRFWDLAATENQSSDWTVGVLMALLDNGYVVVEDVVRLRGKPDTVEKTILATAKIDGVNVSIRYEEEGGSSGLIVTDTYRKLLIGFDFDGLRPTGTKAARAKGFSSYVASKKVLCLLRPWVGDYMRELEAFPNKGVHDDQVDASSGAFNELVMGTRVRLLA